MSIANQLLTPSAILWHAQGMPNKYRLRSFDIEAMQWDGTQEGATPIIDWVLSRNGTARWHEERTLDTSSTVGGKEVTRLRDVPVPPHIALDVRPADVARVWAGDWVLFLGDAEGFDMSSKTDFHLAYEPVIN
jgi:hypothetical protein